MWSKGTAKNFATRRNDCTFYFSNSQYGENKYTVCDEKSFSGSEMLAYHTIHNLSQLIIFCDQSNDTNIM